MPDLILSTPFDFSRLRLEAAEAVLLARRLTEPISDSEVRTLLADLNSRIVRSTGSLTRVPEFKSLDKLSSEAWNQFCQDILIDLRATYDAILSLETSDRQMEAVALSDLNNSKAAILKTINQLQVYRFLKDNPQYQDMKAIDFVRVFNGTTRRPAATIDQDIRMLELPVKARRVVSLERGGGRKTKVTARLIGGGMLGGLGDDFAPENGIDADPSTFWVEVMSTRSQVQMRYQASWGPYQTHGVLAEYEIHLSHPERVNNLKLLPFAEFPMNVVDVCFLEGPDQSRWTTIPGFSIKAAIEDWTEFDFTYITVSALRVVLEQRNYTRNISLVPESVLRKNQLWSRLRTEEYSRTVHEVDLTSNQEGLVAAQPEQLNLLPSSNRVDNALGDQAFIGERRSEYRDYMKYMSSFLGAAEEIAPGSSADITEFSTGQKTVPEDPARTLVSYDYMLGIRSVMLSSLLYETHAHYESGEFLLSGNPVEVGLETTESHPLFVEDDGVFSYRRTSIEHEIEVAPDQRFPILPLSDTEGDNFVIQDEWLKLEKGIGRLRFTPVAGSISIRENGKKVALERITPTGRSIAIEGYLTTAIYTATYHVDEESTKVRIDDLLDSTRLVTPEEFSDTDSENKVVLKYYPYTIYEIVRATRFWKQRRDQAFYEWVPDVFPVSDGTVALSNGATLVTLTSPPGAKDFSSIDFTIFSGTEDLRIWLQDTNETLIVNPGASHTGTTLNLQTAYQGNNIAASKFILGRAKVLDSRIFGLNVQSYEPVHVRVNGVPAVNRTNYLTREHPAMTPANPNEKRYEFIQAGKALYFNGPIKDKIEVTYSWLTQYVKLVSTLRCNVPVATIFTPKLDSARIRLKTTPL